MDYYTEVSIHVFSELRHQYLIFTHITLLFVNFLGFEHGYCWFYVT